MKGDLIINGIDAFLNYGINLQQSGVSVLMTPPPNKEYIENSSRLSNGKTVMTENAKVADRDLTLPLHLLAKNMDDFIEKYQDFCNEVLSKGVINIQTRYIPDTIFRCVYISCTQFSEFCMEYAGFMLKLNEPDPTNRGLTDKNTSDGD